MQSKPECIVIIGNAIEDQNISALTDYNGSIRALHGAMASASGEFFSKGIRIVYYMPGLLDGGFSQQIDQNRNFKFMMSVGQQKPLDVNNTALKIVQSMYIPKVEHVQNTYENTMVVRRDGYKLEVDV
jgi:hypothetical protein